MSANNCTPSERKKLGILDRYLTIWILLAIAIGIAMSYFVPSVEKSINSFSSGITNIPLALGLILMMSPPLAKVKYAQRGRVLNNMRILASSLSL